MGHGNRDKEIIHMEELRWKDGEVKQSKVSMWIKENAKEQELRIKRLRMPSTIDRELSRKL